MRFSFLETSTRRTSLSSLFLPVPSFFSMIRKRGPLLLVPSGLLNLDQFCTLYAFHVMNFGSPDLFLVREIEGNFLMIS